SGAFRPRAPTPHEALFLEERPVSASVEGARVKACRAGACRELEIPELAAAGEHARVVISHDGSLVAAIIDQGVEELPVAKPVHAAVHDVVTGRRLRTLDVGRGGASLEFAADTLIVSRSTC